MTGKNYFFSTLNLFIVFVCTLSLSGYAQPLCTTTAINSYSPATGPAGTVVTLSGSGFTQGAGTTAVQFNGIPAVFATLSDTELWATVPAGNTTGTITVITNGCRAVAAGFTLLAAECAPPEIYISELYDHNSGSYGVIELYNPSGVPLTFNGHYVLERYGTIGDASPSYTLTLEGTIESESTYQVMSNNSASRPCGVFIDDNMGSGINGSDQFKLLKDGAVIDVANAPSNAGYTVIRRPNVIAPKIIQANADWIYTANDCSDLGGHNPGTVSTSNPVVVTQPVSVTVCEGLPAVTFSVAISTANGATYQWKTLDTNGNWVNVTGAGYTGATTASLGVTVTPARNNSQYYCVITTPGCTLISDAAHLTISEAPQATAIVTDISCATGSANITLTPVSGTGLTYSLNGGTYQALASFTNVAAGTHSISIKNADGCITVLSGIVITIPVVPVAVIAPVIQPTCTNANGTLTVTAPLGTDYEYSIDGTNFQSAASFTLPAGSYTVTVRNILTGCTSAGTPIVLNNAPTAPAIPTAITVDPTCTNLNGTLTVTAPLGTDYEYSIDETNFQSAASFTLPAGSYTVTVRNILTGCTSAGTPIVLNNAPTAPAIPTAITIDPTCTNLNGTLTVTAPLGTDYEYSIDGTNFQSAASFTLPAGSYTVTVRNILTGCTSAGTPIVLNNSPTAPAIPTAIAVDPTCTNINGTLTVTAPLGTDYEYSIDGTNFQSAASFTLPAGSYTITVRNTLTGCTSAGTPIVLNNAPTAPATPTAIAVDPTCININGTLTVTAPLGTDYEYSIDGTNFQSAASFTLPAGSYTVTVRNTLTGCTSVGTPIVLNNAPTAPAIPTAIAVDPTCTNINGTLTVTAPLGTDYEYSIDGTNFQSAASFTLPAGSYTITVRNILTGCTSAGTPIVLNNAPTAPAIPVATVTSQPGCSTTTGTLTVNSPVGTGYEYSTDGINFRSTTIIILAPGTYTLTVRNAAGCTATSGPYVINPAPAAPATPIASVMQPDCANATGIITIVSPTGTGYEYSLDGITYQAAASFAEPQGSYTITVRNTAGCTATSAAPVVVDAQPTTPAAPQVSVTPASCASATGSLTVTAPLGTGYEYSIDGITFQSAASFTLPAGSYTVTVRNAAGCSATSGTITIDTPQTGLPELTGIQDCQPAISGKHYILQALAQNNSFDADTAVFAWRIAGQNAVIATGSSFDATEYKNDNNISAERFPLHIEVTVTTPGGCTDTYTFTVESVFCDIPKGISPNNDTRNDSFNLIGLQVVKLTIVNRYGLEVYHKTNYRDEWYGQTDNGQELPSGTYFYRADLPGETRTGWVYINREVR